MKNCSTCRHWRELGACATARHIVYDNRHVMIEPGTEGQCRALPPSQDNRWPLTMGRDDCGCWEGKTLEEADTMGATTGRSTGEPPAPDTAPAAADGGESTAETKPTEALAPGRPPSPLKRLMTGRGHGTGKATR